MALLYPIALDQVDARSPLDEQLMTAIKYDLEDLDTRTASVKAFDYEFKVNGPLNALGKLPAIRLDGQLVTKTVTFASCRAWLEMPGTSGTLTIDVRKYKTPNTPITSIRRLYLQNINSISQIAPASATQSIARATSQILTQSISRWKAALNIQSITVLPAGRSRLDLNAAPDTGWVIGKTITVASASNAANNGTFTIVAVNDDGANNLIIVNASAVEQTSAAGTASLDAWAYVFSNPVSTQFAAGEIATFASHTTGANNGAFEIYAINSGGNNIVVFNSAGVAQGAAAGTADVNRWVYTFASAASSDFVVGETAAMTSHTSGVNNGSFPITGVNINSGNNVTVYNASGTAQGTAAGTVNTNRWVYNLPADPTSQFTVGQTLLTKSTTTISNSGVFTLVKINHLGTNNLVVHNALGVAQAGAGGTLEHTRMLINFSSDQSAVYSAGLSRAEISNVVNSLNSGNFDVIEVNRGGGANYNVVIENAAGFEQLVPSGRVLTESRSIFDSRPTLTLNTSTRNSTNRHLQYVTITSGFSAAASVVAGDQVGAEVVTRPIGTASGLVIQIG